MEKKERQYKNLQQGYFEQKKKFLFIFGLDPIFPKEGYVLKRYFKE